MLDKSALYYGGSRLFVLRAVPPLAAQPAAQKPLANCRRVPIYRARAVRSSEWLPPFAAITLVARQADVITSKDSNLLDSASRNTGQ